MKLRIIWFLAHKLLSEAEYNRRMRAYNVGFGFKFLGIHWGEQ